MSTVTSTDESLRVLKELDPSQNHSIPQTHSTKSEPHNLEMLVRLIVKEELQRQTVAQSSGFPHGENTHENDEQRRDAASTMDDASDGEPDAEVMSAEDVAAFLGVDRNTVYDYAGRGTIPCRRLGKRLLFHRPVLVSWLDPCRAALTRKA